MTFSMLTKTVEAVYFPAFVCKKQYGIMWRWEVKYTAVFWIPAKLLTLFGGTGYFTNCTTWV